MKYVSERQRMAEKLSRLRKLHNMKERGVPESAKNRFRQKPYYMTCNLEDMVETPGDTPKETC